MAVKKTETTTVKKPTISELEQDSRYVTKSEFREMIPHQGLSEATIYNRLRGVGKNGKPTKSRLEGVQASDGSWWVDLEGASVKRLLKAEKEGDWKTETSNRAKGATPAELREMVSKDDEKIKSLELVNEGLRAENSKIKDLEAEIENLQEELKETKEELIRSKAVLEYLKSQGK